MLFIGHDLDGVAAVSHELVVLKHGRVVEWGGTRSVLTWPAGDYARALVAAMEEVRIVPGDDDLAGDRAIAVILKFMYS